MAFSAGASPENSMRGTAKTIEHGKKNMQPNNSQNVEFQRIALSSTRPQKRLAYISNMNTETQSHLSGSPMAKNVEQTTEDHETSMDGDTKTYYTLKNRKKVF